MKSENISNISNTKKEISLVPGSKDIYLASYGTGNTVDLYEEMVAHLLGKQTANISTLSNSLWYLFKKDDYMSYAEFVKKLEKGELAPIGMSPIVLTKKNISVDMNGNILVSTINSNQTSDYNNDNGNMLIRGVGENSGAVIRKPQASTVIHAVNDATGFYQTSRYNYRKDPKTGKITITGREYNFLDGDGKILRNSENFTKPTDFNEIKITPVNRNYYDRDHGKQLSDWNILPTAYVVATTSYIDAYSSARDLIIENRRRKNMDGEELLNDEKKYLVDMFKYENDLNNTKIEELGKKFDNGEITARMYNKVLDVINDELAKIEEFKEKFATPEDKKLEEKMYEYLDQHIVG